MTLTKTTLAALLAVAGLAASGTASAALVVTTTTNANTLANTLAGGGGVTINSATLTGGTTQQGTFSGGVSSGIGIESGVILTSGSATLAPGPNNSDGAGQSLGTAGDSQLGSLIPGFSTLDANILNIKFTTTTGSLFFKYAFASEEYNEYVGTSFNDVFGFFLNGVNIALIPGTSTPVAINNINCGGSGTGIGSNCGFFNNNDPTNGTPTPFNIQYDGFTDVFTASATGLLANTEYTIKLAIADAGDTILDSAVFLQANTFSGEDPGKVPEPGSLALLSVALLGMAAMRRRRS